MSNVSELKAPVDGLEVTVFELQILRAVFSGQSTGSNIKDLRLIDSVMKKIESYYPEQPKPTPGPQPENPQAPTEAEIQALQEHHKAWTETVQKYLDSTVALPLSQYELMVVRDKFKAFHSFQTNDTVRPKVLALADKLGV